MDGAMPGSTLHHKSTKMVLGVYLSSHHRRMPTANSPQQKKSLKPCPQCMLIPAWYEKHCSPQAFAHPHSIQTLESL
jgi:hypothetical protein